MFGGLVAVNDVSFDGAREGDRLDHRAQRRRQDDVLQLLTGLYKPTVGTRRVRRQRHHRQAAGPRSPHAGIARTFQNIKLFQTMTAIENVQVGEHGGMRSRVTGLVFRTPLSAARGAGGRAQARELLDFVGLKRPTTSSP